MVVWKVVAAAVLLAGELEEPVGQVVVAGFAVVAEEVVPAGEVVVVAEVLLGAVIVVGLEQEFLPC